MRASPPNVLISDIGMPGEDGYSLIRKVRALDRTRGQTTPALALTAYARSEDRMQAIRSGYQMHIAKPVEIVEEGAIRQQLTHQWNQRLRLLANPQQGLDSVPAAVRVLRRVARDSQQVCDHALGAHESRTPSTAASYAIVL